VSTARAEGSWVEFAGAGPDRAAESDRAWFERHPNASVLVRRRIPREFGEFEAEAGPGRFVRVIQLERGVRLRLVAMQ